MDIWTLNKLLLLLLNGACLQNVHHGKEREEANESTNHKSRTGLYHVTHGKHISGNQNVNKKRSYNKTRNCITICDKCRNTFLIWDAYGGGSFKEGNR